MSCLAADRYLLSLGFFPLPLTSPRCFSVRLSVLMSLTLSLPLSRARVQELELLIQHADDLDLFFGEGCVTESYVSLYIHDMAPHPQVSIEVEVDYYRNQYQIICFFCACGKTAKKCVAFALRRWLWGCLSPLARPNSSLAARHAVVRVNMARARC